ncbi:MAG TPA: hypothetical protein VFB15_01640 [Candidatus Binataceae bacterium]|jgi:hypothetical protein|nr:hypothetical protein [Candidatus Binataceae bacterium]
MSLQEENGHPADAEVNQTTAHQNDSVANKLSRELSNWRRRRSHGRPGRGERPSVNFQAEAARTIKVRGHETLVIRKPKSGLKAPGGSNEPKP